MLKTGNTKHKYTLGELIPYGERIYKVTLIYQMSDEQMAEYNLYGRNRVQLTNINNISDIMDFAITD